MRFITDITQTEVTMVKNCPVFSTFHDLKLGTMSQIRKQFFISVNHVYSVSINNILICEV
jgi:hypothetical protein